MDTSSAESLKRVAQQLIQAREAQNISLEEIATKTFIPMRILKALEAGETFKLPEPIFVQGFIKRYAKLVGLDADALAKEIPLNTQPVAVDLIKEAPRPPLVDVINKRVSLDSPSTSAKQSLVDPVKSQRSMEATNREAEATSTNGTRFSGSISSVVKPDAPQSYGSGNQSTDRPSWLLPAIVGAILGFGFLVGAILLLKGSQTAETATTAIPQKASEKVTPQAAAKPNPNSKSTSSPAPDVAVTVSPAVNVSPAVTVSPTPSVSPIASGPVNVSVSLNDASWVEVRVDGEVKFEGTLAKGVKQSWSGKKEVEISSGNAGAVMVTHNQSPAKALGGAGQVETKKFSAKN